MGTYALLYAIELTLASDGDESSTFLATVYVKNPLKKQDGAVGSITDTIGGILAKAKNGGTRILCMTMPCFTDTISSDQSARSTSWQRYFQCA